MLLEFTPLEFETQRQILKICDELLEFTPLEFETVWLSETIKSI